MPSSSASDESRVPPYTASPKPAACARNERRDRPVPAGSGIPGSIVGRPLPASATAARKSFVRVQSRQSTSGRLHIRRGGDELPQRDLDCLGRGRVELLARKRG